MNLPEDFVFSQSSLQDYQHCARRFQLRYLDRVRYPAPQSEPLLEFERHMQQGAAFHHLIHQHLLGIPEQMLTERTMDVTVRRWWECYLEYGLLDMPAQRHPEITLSAPLGEYRLIAKYDLLAIQPGQKAIIVDWKTSRKKPRRPWLAQRMQTLVYRYVLAAAGAHLNEGAAIPPETIEMVYWFAQVPETPERFPYTRQQFEEDGEQLLGMVDHINMRQRFPLVVDDKPCRFCTYRSLCDRGSIAGDLEAWMEDFDDLSDDDILIDMDQIGEIAF